jgi:hypothetical protein
VLPALICIINFILYVHRGVRYLVRVENSGHTPSQYRELRTQFRSRLLAYGCRLNSSRISSHAIELDFFAPSRAEAEAAISSLERVINVSVLDREKNGSAQEIMQEALQLFNQERFWEVHETVESLWKKAQGEEKRALQSIILFASALVHYQKNEEDVALRMIKRAYDMMPEGTLYCFDLSFLRREAEAMLRNGHIHIPKIQAQ